MQSKHQKKCNFSLKMEVERGNQCNYLVADDISPVGRSILDLEILYKGQLVIMYYW